MIPGMKSPAQMLEGWSVNSIVIVQSGMRWTASDSTKDDLLGTGENTNSHIGGGVIQYWNYSGPPSAFAVNSPNAIPCYGKYTGCVSTFIAAPAAIQAACLTAAQAPYAGNTQLQRLAVAALTNAGCYVQGGGVLTPPAYGTVGNAGRASSPANPITTWTFRCPSSGNLGSGIAPSFGSSFSISSTAPISQLPAAVRIQELAEVSLTLGPRQIRPTQCSVQADLATSSLA